MSATGPEQRPAGILAILEEAHEPVAMDAIDRRILHILHEDSHISQRALAAKVGLSAPSVAERVARLERTKVIKRHSIEVDWGALGFPMLVVIPMKFAANADPLRIMTELRQIPSLTEILILTGAHDMMARFRVRDHADLQRLLLERIWAIDGLESVETMISLGRVDDAAPLRHILPEEDAPTGRTEGRRGRS